MITAVCLTALSTTPTLGQRLLPLVAALLIAGVTVELIRRRKLREEYAMLWLFASAMLLVFGLAPSLLLFIQRKLGVFYLTIVGVVGFSFVTLVLIHLAVIVTRLSDGNRQLTQQVALLQKKLEEQSGTPLIAERADEAQEPAARPEANTGDEGR